MLAWIIPIVSILGGLIAGWIFEKIFLQKLQSLLSKPKIPHSEVFVNSLKGVIRIWLIIAGFYGALVSLHTSQLITNPIFLIGQNGLIAIFLYFFTLVIARLGSSFIRIWSQRTPGVSASLLANLTKIIILVFGILTILQAIGISITPILATLGIGGLAVALAFQDTLSNLFSGLYLIISQQVRTGDYIKLETGQEGYVIDITWRNTVVRELQNNLVLIPNSKLASAIFTNYHLPAKDVGVRVNVSVSYQSDLEQVEEVTLQVARELKAEYPQLYADFDPAIFYENFGDFSINFVVVFRANEFLEQRAAKHQFIKRLHRRYREVGIEIPYPSHNVYMPSTNHRNAKPQILSDE
ncbi:MAG: mechanosensitive ion channel family protein [Desertifilum sp.]|nr:mechanosensitive ion channel family protein [Desertifilum sp.]